MTVCIAAIADSGDAIIGASDQMITAGPIATEFPFLWKSHRVHETWFVLYSGTNINHVPLILREVEAALQDEDDVNVSAVARAFTHAYSEVRNRIAEQTVLSQFGLDMTAFTNMLVTDSGGSEASDLKHKIESLEFDCEFLVIGFDPDKKAHIFTVFPPGVESHYDSIGFWSIGIGSDAALSSLFFRRYRPFKALASAIYLVAEAKFVSESATGIGKNTAVWAVKSDKTVTFIHAGAMRELRELWEAEGQPPIPPTAKDWVKDQVKFQKLAKFNT